jgi:hypothetical protein
LALEANLPLTAVADFWVEFLEAIEIQSWGAAVTAQGGVDI